MRIAESLSLPMYVSYFIFLPPELNILLVLLWSCYYFFFREISGFGSGSSTVNVHMEWNKFIFIFFIVF